MDLQNTTYKCLLVEEEGGRFRRSIVTKSVRDLPENELLIRVQYSSLNFKDALSSCGNKGITKSYPHTPGIDAVGLVVRSNNENFHEGDEVLVTGFDLGMNTPGGFSQYISVPAAWALRLPNGLSMKESMIFGTAGLTAGMSVLRLSEHINPEDGKILVSGSTGGVGAITISVLAKLGFAISAISGKDSQEDYLFQLGASEVIARKDFEQENERALMKGEYAGGVDTVGGSVLSNMVKSTRPLGVVICCGNVASSKLNVSIFPFILRGVSLIGIDSQNSPMTCREVVWNKLAKDWKIDSLNGMHTTVSLSDLSRSVDLMLDGKSRGRMVLDLGA